MQAHINRNLSGKNNATPFKSSSLCTASIQVASMHVLEVLTTKETVKITQIDIFFNIAHNQNEGTYYFEPLVVEK